MDDQTTFMTTEEMERLMALDSTESLISERHKTHGAYNDTARIIQSFKRVVRNELYHRHTRGQAPLTDSQYESMDMILVKIGRIISGDSAYEGHWSDIAGYAKIANGQS